MFSFRAWVFREWRCGWVRVGGMGGRACTSVVVAEVHPFFPPKLWNLTSLLWSSWTAKWGGKGWGKKKSVAGESLGWTLPNLAIHFALLCVVLVGKRISAWPPRRVIVGPSNRVRGVEKPAL